MAQGKRVQAKGFESVQVWYADIDIPENSVSPAFAFVNNEERLRAALFHRRRDALRFLAGRNFLRELIGNFLNTNPSEVRFNQLSNGKPVLVRPATRPQLHFSFSRSEGSALVGISQCHVLGIDLEKLRPIPEWRAIASRFFTSKELADLDRSGEVAQAQFLRLWTLKEAVLKTTGDGLFGSLADFEFSFDAFGKPQFRWLTSTIHECTVVPFQPIDGHVAALSLRHLP
jgi:4'-phosphopantetheinyl transferase